MRLYITASVPSRCSRALSGVFVYRPRSEQQNLAFVGARLLGRPSYLEQMKFGGNKPIGSVGSHNCEADDDTAQDDEGGANEVCR
jgi:hypothetical protein